MILYYIELYFKKHMYDLINEKSSTVTSKCMMNSQTLSPLFQ